MLLALQTLSNPNMLYWGMALSTNAQTPASSNDLIPKLPITVRSGELHASHILCRMPGMNAKFSFPNNLHYIFFVFNTTCLTAIKCNYNWITTSGCSIKFLLKCRVSYLPGQPHMVPRGGHIAFHDPGSWKHAGFYKTSKPTVTKWGAGKKGGNIVCQVWQMSWGWQKFEETKPCWGAERPTVSARLRIAAAATTLLCSKQDVHR